MGLIIIKIFLLYTALLVVSSVQLIDNFGAIMNEDTLRAQYANQ